MLLLNPDFNSSFNIFNEKEIFYYVQNLTYTNQRSKKLFFEFTELYINKTLV